MERRKVIRQGKGTLTMSLPMKWVKQLKLSSGDELEVEQRGLQLLIGPGRKQSKKITEIDLTGYSKNLVFVILNNLYVKGYEEITLRFETAEHYEAIVESVRSLIGFEIIHQTKDMCIVKELARTESEEFDNILRRIFLLLLSSADDGYDAYKTNNVELLKTLKKRDIAINTLVTYCLRVLNTRGGADIQKALHLHTLLTLLEQLGDTYERFYRDVTKINQQTLLLVQRVNALLRQLYELFYKFDKQKANKLKEERDAIREALQQTKVKTKDDILAVHFLRSIADLIVDIEKFDLAMQF